MVEQYKRALRAKGDKLTLGEIMAGRATNANDCPIIISNALAQLRDAAFVVGGLETRKFVGPGQAAVCWKQPVPRWSAGSRQPQWDEFVRQFNESSQALAMIRAALTNPPADAGPLTELWFQPRVNFVGIRQAAQCLAAAAICDLRQGRREEALQNLEALGALARMYDRECTLVAQMIRVGITGF